MSATHSILIYAFIRGIVTTKKVITNSNTIVVNMLITFAIDFVLSSSVYL